MTWYTTIIFKCNGKNKISFFRIRTYVNKWYEWNKTLCTYLPEACNSRAWCNGTHQVSRPYSDFVIWKGVLGALVLAQDKPKAVSHFWKRKDDSLLMKILFCYWGRWRQLDISRVCCDVYLFALWGFFRQIILHSATFCIHWGIPLRISFHECRQ